MRDVVTQTKDSFIDPNLLDDEPSSIIFCNFGEMNSLDYNLVKSNSQLIASLNDIIENYNSLHSKR